MQLERKQKGVMAGMDEGGDDGVAGLALAFAEKSTKEKQLRKRNKNKKNKNK